MSAFTSFPNVVERHAVSRLHRKCSAVFCEDTNLVSYRYAALRDAIHAASPVVRWRETCKDTDIGDPVLCLDAWRDNFETPPVLTKSFEVS